MLEFENSTVGKTVKKGGKKVGYVAYTANGKFQFVANDGELGERGSFSEVKASVEKQYG